MDIDRETLAAIFAARVRLVKMTREEAISGAGAEWDAAQAWFASRSTQEKSFLWFCDEFDLEPTAVRRAVKEKT